MGTAHIPSKVKLFTGLIYGDEEILQEVKTALESKFRNSIAYESAPLEFTYTNYYNEEMGGNLKRRFISFKDHVPLEDIYKKKIGANNVERAFSESGRRRVNIDPGYIDLAKLVLFSTKDYSHRIYLADGIYAEITLIYKDRHFNHMGWTYPDYKSSAYLKIFNDIRKNYKRELTDA
ncbi:MAG: DUF4416 family protein [Candidatus Omnitrophica bacterium]|nr:DUF4416 family protein [Candidatus Omnitrophota bacterium]